MCRCIEYMDIEHPSITDINATDEFLIGLSTALSSDGRFRKMIQTHLLNMNQ